MCREAVTETETIILHQTITGQVRSIGRPGWVFTISHPFSRRLVLSSRVAGRSLLTLEATS